MAQIFPRWTNYLPTAVVLLGPGVAVGAIFVVWYWFSPWYTDVGYEPQQPVEFSHKLHVGDIELDCRYCHNTVEYGAVAAIPPTTTCMNCHSMIRKGAQSLAPIQASFDTGDPVPWVRVHQLPDYVFFDHSAHLNAGVGCASCHGRIDTMRRVRMVKPLSMAWCFDCHQGEYEDHIRPADHLTDMDYDPIAANYDYLADPDRQRELNPPIHCSGCHR